MTKLDREKQFLDWLVRFGGLITKIVNSFSESAEDREDLHQEILFQLWKSTSKFKGQSKDSTWIYKVALNKALTWKRKENRPANLEYMDNLTVNSDNDKQVLLTRLYAEIRTLPPIDRSLILLSLEGTTYAEMADILGISESNVGVRLHRAKAQLSERMGKYSDEI